MKYLVIFFTAIFLFFPVKAVSAQTPVEHLPFSATESAIATPPAQIPYDLPYPGILPDNPLYFLKVVRDRVVGVLINDRIKKAEFNLLQSDKKIFASEMLFAKGKEDLAIDTLSKSNNYMHQAISETKKADTAGKDVAGVASRISASINKHEKVIENILKGSRSQKKRIQDEHKRLQDIESFYNNSFDY